MSVQQTKATGKAEKFRLKLGAKVRKCVRACMRIRTYVRVYACGSPCLHRPFLFKDSPTSAFPLLHEPECHQT